MLFGGAFLKRELGCHMICMGSLLGWLETRLAQTPCYSHMGWLETRHDMYKGWLETRLAQIPAIHRRPDASRHGKRVAPAWGARARMRAMQGRTANLRTKILDFRGFDSSRILILRCGILMSLGSFLEVLGRAILVGIILVGRLDVSGHTPSMK